MDRWKALAMAPILALGRVAGCDQKPAETKQDVSLSPPALSAPVSAPGKPLASLRQAEAASPAGEGPLPASLEDLKARGGRIFDGAGTFDGWTGWKARMLDNADARQAFHAASLKRCDRDLGGDRPRPASLVSLDAAHALGSRASRARAAGRKDDCDLGFGYWKRLIELSGFGNHGVQTKDRLQEAYFNMGLLYAERAGPGGRDPTVTRRALDWLSLVRRDDLAAAAAPVARGLKGRLAESECSAARHYAGRARTAREWEAVRRRAQTILSDYPGAGQDACARELLASAGR